MTMRKQEYENKQRIAPLPPEYRECVVRHKWYQGSECDECGRRIPVGPYSPEQMADLFGSALFIGQRRASDPAPDELANPVTERETVLRADLVVAAHLVVEGAARRASAPTVGGRSGC